MGQQEYSQSCKCIGLLGGRWENYYDSDRRVYSVYGCSPCIRTVTGGGKELKLQEPEPSFRFRKFTPLECWRLMGFEDNDYEKAASVNPHKTTLYRQAGNSVVVDVLMAIFNEIIKE